MAFFNHTKLRVKDAVKSLAFYTDVLKMSLVDKFHYAAESHYFLATLPDGYWTAEPGTAEAHTALFSLPYPTLSLLHHHGTETSDVIYDSGVYSRFAPVWPQFGPSFCCWRRQCGAATWLWPHCSDGRGRVRVMRGAGINRHCFQEAAGRGAHERPCLCAGRRWVRACASAWLTV